MTLGTSATNVPLPKHEGVKYRPDIDGLRALAILPVVWFHSDLPGLPGGFTGVDTFFVISGYLITLIIHRDIAAGQFSFARFYERRIRRIAPALLLAISCSTLAAYWLLLPYELDQYARSDVAALGMVSNVYFWLTADYFALADEITPLLHTWSLGVEEQFYLLFPPALLIAERLRMTRPAVVLFLVGSLGLSLFVTPHSPAAAFYLLPTRGWELMAGATLAIGLWKISDRLKELGAIAGVALLVIAAVWITASDGIPGWRSMIPVLGATLLIAGGPDTSMARFLSARPLVAIGRISYSLYLFHWPVFVFLREFLGVPRLPVAAAIGGIIVSVALATLSYAFVETPARLRSIPYRRVLALCVAALIVNVAAAALAWAGHGLPQRLNSEVVATAAIRDQRAPLAKICSHGLDLNHCRLGADGPPRFALWGDSQAAALSEATEEAIGAPGLLLAVGGCAPALNWVGATLKGNDRSHCRRSVRESLRIIQHSRSISLVILSARWSAYDDYGGLQFWRAAQEIVDALNASGKRVVVIAGIPTLGVDAPWADAIRTRFHRSPLQLGCAGEPMHLHNVAVVDVHDGFCNRPARGLFNDNVHVSRKAALDIVAPRLAALMAKGSSGSARGQNPGPATCPSSLQGCPPAQPAH